MREKEIFARIENNQLLLRISFDNMVVRKSNPLASDNFEGMDISASIVVLDKSSKNQIFNYNIPIHQLHFNKDFCNYIRSPHNNLLEMAFDLNSAIPAREDI